MRVGWLAYGLDRPLSGISRYTQQVLCSLAETGDSTEFVILSTGPTRDLHCGLRSVTLRGCNRLPSLLLLGSVAMSRIARRMRLDIVHDPTGVAPLLFGAGEARTVVTIHDVFAWSCPGNSTLLDTFIYRHWLPRVLPRVGAVITDSQVSRSDIVRYLNVPQEKMHVIHIGVDSRFSRAPSEDIARVRGAHGLPPEFVLFLGSVEKRKNVRGLLQAYAVLRQRGEQRPLVVAGVRRSNAGDLPQLVAQLGLQDHVLFTGYIPDADLPALYSGADLFVFPSLYEGFGLPPLEAMACGTPVVCSDAGSLPEVVGDAAIMVNPHDVEGLAEAMQHVLADRDLQQELQQKGLQRAQWFSWDKAARKTLEVYEMLVGEQVQRRPSGS